VLTAPTGTRRARGRPPLGPELYAARSARVDNRAKAPGTAADGQPVPLALLYPLLYCMHIALAGLAAVSGE